MNKAELRPITESDLKTLLSWRNSAKVRQFMYTTHLVETDEHERWFAVISKDDRRHPLLFLLDGVPSGFVNIGPVKPGGIADWGFYTAPEAKKGTGYQMGVAALAHAFNVLGLHKLCGEALAHNEASQNFHERLGFQREGRLRDHHFDGSSYHSVFCYGLLKKDWVSRYGEISDEQEY